MIALEVDKEELESLKTALDMSVTYWKREADKETDQKYKDVFQKLQQKYSALFEKVETHLK